MTTEHTAASPRTAAAIQGRRADTSRRRERVLVALSKTQKAGTQISVTTLAHTAGVDRTFLYRHRDLLEQLHTVQAQPADDPVRGPMASRASLSADLAAAHQRASRLSGQIQQLERRLSQTLGQQAWHESGLGTPDDIDQLNGRITTLEQMLIDIRLQLEQRDQDLTAARAANRELITKINTDRVIT
jgi:chromosome segregation ATPase